MNIIKKTMPFIILISTLSFVLVTIFGMDNSLLIENTYNGVKLYTFNLQKYIEGIQSVWTEYLPDWTEVKLNTDIMYPQSAWDILGWFKSFVHNWAVAISWQLLPLSALTYIGNWIIFAVQMLLSLLGFPAQSTFMNFLEFLKQLATVPTKLVNGFADLFKYI